LQVPNSIKDLSKYVIRVLLRLESKTAVIALYQIRISYAQMHTTSRNFGWSSVIVSAYFFGGGDLAPGIDAFGSAWFTVPLVVERSSRRPQHLDRASAGCVNLRLPPIIIIIVADKIQTVLRCMQLRHTRL